MGNNIFEHNNERMTTAAQRGDIHVIEELICQGTDVNTPNKDGMTPLIVAVYNHQHDAVKLLLASGADVNIADASGSSALMGAAFKGYTDIARYLITAGSDLDTQNRNGSTA
jgi:ankyrin repeat protein